MTPERTGAQVIDLARVRPWLMEARRRRLCQQRVQEATDEIIRELRLQDGDCPDGCRTQPPVDQKPSPGDDAA
jgi:hypothetical protein